MSTWASIQDVKDLPGGVEVDQAAVNHAEQSIELAVGVVAELYVGRLSRSDLYWLKLAVAHQAVWEASQPDLMTRTNVKTFTQDGLSATLAPDGLVLAPLAAKAVKRLSWRGSRTVGGAQRRRVIRDPQGDDATLPWEPLGVQP